MARRTKKDAIREQMGTKTKTIKIKRKRKPMTEEQKAAAVERLAKARAIRLEKQGGPKNVHPDVLKLDDNDALSLKNVRIWIKTQKELLASARSDLRANVKGAEARVQSHEKYVRNLKRYISTGEYIDMFYGEHQQSLVKYTSVVPAYDKDGNVKRSFGVYYADLGATYYGPGRVKRDGVIEEVDYV